MRLCLAAHLWLFRKFNSSPLGSIERLLLWLQHHFILMISFQLKVQHFSFTARQHDVDGVVPSPCGFELRQAAAANWSQADIPKWALNAVCCSPALGVSHWGRLLGRHRRLPLEAMVTLIHASCICSVCHFSSLISFSIYLSIIFADVSFKSCKPFHCLCSFLLFSGIWPLCKILLSHILIIYHFCNRF